MPTSINFDLVIQCGYPCDFSTFGDIRADNDCERANDKHVTQRWDSVSRTSNGRMHRMTSDSLSGEASNAFLSRPRVRVRLSVHGISWICLNYDPSASPLSRCQYKTTDN